MQKYPVERPKCEGYFDTRRACETNNGRHATNQVLCFALITQRPFCLDVMNLLMKTRPRVESFIFRLELGLKIKLPAFFRIRWQKEGTNCTCVDQSKQVTVLCLDHLSSKKSRLKDSLPDACMSL